MVGRCIFAPASVNTGMPLHIAGQNAKLTTVNLHCTLRHTARALLLCALTAAAHAQSITGVVTNKTTNKPAAGDDVVLIRLAQGMQEATRTKSDARGRYTLDLPDPGLHLVRVTHDKANYFQPAPPGTTSVNVDVYNAAAQVAGVAQEADVLRLQTDASGKQLKVVENFFVRNDSTPPRTQFSDKPLEFYLPAGAVVQGSAALAPGGMPVQAAPVPLGDPNHYTFIFPIRPGETRFQVTYTLPYSGSLSLAPRPSLPTDTVAIMMPKSMTFKGGNATSYSPVAEETTAQTYVARNVSPSQPLSFTISGTGEMPRDTPVPDNAATPGAGNPGGAQEATQDSGTAPTSNKLPGGGLGNPVDPGATNDPWAKYRWWIIGGLGLVLAAGAGVMLRRPAGGAGQSAGPISLSPHTHPAAGPGSLPAVGSSTLNALKEELFHLETERLQGHISDGDYTAHKAALEQVLRRVLQRGAAGQPTPALAPDLAARSGLNT